MGLQSDILEKAKSQVLSAFQNRVESIGNLEDLDSLLENFNLAIEVSISTGSNYLPQPQLSPKGNGVRKMWKALRKIVKTEGVSMKEARILYLRNKEDHGNGVQTRTKQTRSNGTKMSQAQKKYWRAINKIVFENSCTIAEARQIYKKSKAA
jgi:hypothetical protein